MKLKIDYSTWRFKIFFRLYLGSPKHVWHSSIGVQLNLSKALLWNGAITPMSIIYQHGELWRKVSMKEESVERKKKDLNMS